MGYLIILTRWAFKYCLLYSVFLSSLLFVLQNNFFWKIAFVLVTENSTQYVGMTNIVCHCFLPERTWHKVMTQGRLILGMGRSGTSWGSSSVGLCSSLSAMWARWSCMDSRYITWARHGCSIISWKAHGFGWVTYRLAMTSLTSIA